MSSPNPIAVLTGSPTKKAKRAAPKDDDSDVRVPAGAENASPTDEYDDYGFDDETAATLADAFNNLDLEAFERGLQKEEDEEERQKIHRELSSRVYFRTGKYNQKRREMLVALGAKWEKEIKAWFVPDNHTKVEQLLKVYTKVLLSKSDLNALVEAILKERKDWEEKRATGRR